MIFRLTENNFGNVGDKILCFSPPPQKCLYDKKILDKGLYKNNKQKEFYSIGLSSNNSGIQTLQISIFSSNSISGV
jgi:hypothetical protein